MDGKTLILLGLGTVILLLLGFCTSPLSAREIDPVQMTIERT